MSHTGTTAKPSIPRSGSQLGSFPDSAEMVPSKETLSVPGLETTPDLFIIRSRRGKVHSP